jgi:hypothetical protein
MTNDPDDTASGDWSWGEIGANRAGYVRAANAVLASLQGRGARWWGYSVSHTNFEVVIGKPWQDDNIVLCLAACKHVTGPVEWPRQQIEVTFEDDPQHPDKPGTYTLQDPTVNFRAEGGVFRWRRGYDIAAHHQALWGGRRGGAAQAKLEEVLASLKKTLEDYYAGQINFGDLEYRVQCLLWYRLPVIRTPKPGSTGQ